jgi:hypothetical protein
VAIVHVPVPALHVGEREDPGVGMHAAILRSAPMNFAPEDRRAVRGV